MRAILPISSRAVLAALVLLSATAGSLLAQGIDRSRRPAPAEQPPLTLPKIELHALTTGVPVAIMPDKRLPLVSVKAVIDIRLANDPADQTGLGELTLAMLREGTTHRTADEIADAAAALGMSVAPTGFFTITANLDSALALMAKELLEPAFPQEALDRLKVNLTANLKRWKESPAYLANTLFGNVLYGTEHPYARQQTEESIATITRDDVIAFYQSYIRPPNVRFVVVGDVSADDAVTRLNRVFGRWASGQSAKVAIPVPAGPKHTAIYLYDRPGSPQSEIVAGTLGPRRDAPDYHAITIMNTVLGGAFSSRLNLNLREQHGYTYGASSYFEFRRVPEVGTVRASAAVQTAKTDSALIELMRELKEIRGARPITPTELSFAKASATKGLPLRFETVAQRAATVERLLIDSLPLDYYATLSANLAAVTLAQTRTAARAYLDPERLAIVVVGDRERIEPGLRAANVAPVVVVSLNGMPVEVH